MSQNPQDPHSVTSWAWRRCSSSDNEPLVSAARVYGEQWQGDRKESILTAMHALLLQEAQNGIATIEFQMSHKTLCPLLTICKVPILTGTLSVCLLKSQIK